MRRWRWKQHELICGLDEAGRGALAGPLIAAAVTLSQAAAVRLGRQKIIIKDGKLLTPGARLKVYRALLRLNIIINVEVISPRQINNRGIGRANKIIMRKLIKAVAADSYIVDGNLHLGRIKDRTTKIQSVVDADANILPTILAGIVAKVVRDSQMRQLHRLFPAYGWNRNAGYGTPKHIRAIAKHGPSRFHRNVFVATALRHHQAS